MMPPMVQNVLNNLFGTPATRTFPVTRREPFEQARGTVQFEIDKCVFCGLCSMRCPAGAIKVVRADKEIIFEPFRCILCGACEDACNKDSVHLRSASRSPVGEKPVEHYKKAEAPPAEPAATTAPAAPADAPRAG